AAHAMVTRIDSCWLWGQKPSQREPSRLRGTSSQNVSSPRTSNSDFSTRPWRASLTLERNQEPLAVAFRKKNHALGRKAAAARANEAAAAFVTRNGHDARVPPSMRNASAAMAITSAKTKVALDAIPSAHVTAS